MLSRRLAQVSMSADCSPAAARAANSAQARTDAEDVSPDMVARYEFEVDTTRAVAGWEA